MDMKKFIWVINKNMLVHTLDKQKKIFKIRLMHLI